MNRSLPGRPARFNGTVILTRVPDGLLVVRQPDHGTQTGLFAASWGNEAVAPPREHRSSQVLAATHHDDGWAVWERRPTLDEATGQPVPFLSLTPLEHVPLYRAGIARAAEWDPWAGLLVSMHGAGLYNDRYGTFRLVEQHFSEAEQVVVDEFLSDMAELQQRLATRVLGREPAGHASVEPAVREDYLTLQVWDRLSLQFAFRHAADGEIAPLPGAGDVALRCVNDGAFALRLDPYPFAEDDAVFPVRATVVPDRRYASPEDFLACLVDAGERVLECRVRAGRIR